MQTDASPFVPYIDAIASSQIGSAALGAVLLLAGRRLFWLFLAAIGFIMATHYAAIYFHAQDQKTLLMIGIAAGVIGATIAVFVQKLAISLAGALAGAYYGAALLTLAAFPDLVWVGMIAGAIIGALLMHFVFRWTLIVLSSIAGAELIVRAIPLRIEILSAVFLVLVVVGLVMQGRPKKSA